MDSRRMIYLALEGADNQEEIKMVQPIDERHDIDDQIVRNLYLEVGRGTN